MNYRTNSYEPFEIPDSRKVKVWTYNMTERVACAHCGRALTFGETYTSLELDVDGDGYAVCPDCFREELERLNAAVREKRSARAS